MPGRVNIEKDKETRTSINQPESVNRYSSPEYRALWDLSLILREIAENTNSPTEDPGDVDEKEIANPGNLPSSTIPEPGRRAR